MTGTYGPDITDPYQVGVHYEEGVEFDAACVSCADEYGVTGWHAVAVEGPRARLEADFICDDCAARYDGNITELLAILRDSFGDMWSAQYLVEKFQMRDRAHMDSMWRQLRYFASASCDDCVLLVDDATRFDVGRPAPGD